ncbi:HpcH/HpaI aldolase/citrate lyase family protein [Moraxella oblonga]|uniref:HpcH/HpaI aldolase/citrate lyase family protein n=1 Tax=Moraxella oblonga TaxID=200413 RepID=UPI000830CDB9|nr:CoA ester lyase [Moraxella oblonga]
MQNFLFVPATRLDRVAKAVATGVDNVIIDLEDAVFDSDKNELYQSLQAFCQEWDWTSFDKIWLRIVGVRHADFMADVALLDLPFFGVVLPKVQNADDVQKLTNFTNKPILAMIECANGVLNVPNIAQSGIWGLSYGCLDLATSLGVSVSTPSAQVLFDKVRTELLLHSAVNGLNSPIESVYPDFDDDGGFKRYVKHWQDFGMGGQLLIHPKQVKMLHLLRLDKNRLAFAQKITAHHQSTGEVVFAIDGQMVDLPVINWAKDYVASFMPLQ